MTAEAKVFTFDGSAEPDVAVLDDRLFGAEVNADLLHRTVRMQLANRRQGTHSTKTRGEVSGGGRKPWRQKGTGRARAGSRRSPIWVGGGTTFGPKPRSYATKLTRKMRQGALRSALSDRASDGNVVLIDRIPFDRPKTKSAVELLERLGLSESTLVVVATSEYGRATQRSFRNLPRAKCIACAGINVYDILRHEHLALTIGAVEELEGRL
ncbi:MAG: 50S ribosomal protein L4 [Candidatus Bipolaricaulia bacterium]